MSEKTGKRAKVSQVCHATRILISHLICHARHHSIEVASGLKIRLDNYFTLELIISRR